MASRVGCSIAAIAAVIIAATPGCLDPTEITITIHTDSCSSLKTVELYVGSEQGGTPSAPSAVATKCDDASSGDVGSITLVPSSGLGDEIDITLVGTLFGGSCKPDSTTDPSCIIARRAIAFAPHTPRQLDVRLDGACAGVQCPPDETCGAETGQGVCKSTCQTGCADGGGGAVDAGGVDVIIMPDAAPPLKCTAPTPLPTVKAYWVWSFSNPLASNLQEDSALVTVAFAPNAKIASDTTSPCASFLRVGSSIQQLSPDQFPLSDVHLAVTAWYRASPGPNVKLVSLEGANGAMRASIDTTNHLNIVTIIGTSFATLKDAQPSADGMWHFLHVDVDTQAQKVSAWRDGTPVGVGTLPLPNGYTNAGPLFVGPSLDVDQVQLFAYGASN